MSFVQHVPRHEKIGRAKIRVPVKPYTSKAVKEQAYA